MHLCAVTMTWTYYVSWLHSFNSLRINSSKDLLLSDILIFVKIKKEITLLHLKMQVQEALVRIQTRHIRMKCFRPYKKGSANIQYIKY